MDKSALEELIGKKPEELSGESLKLFNAIMKIADERDEYLKIIKEAREYMLEERLYDEGLDMVPGSDLPMEAMKPLFDKLNIDNLKNQ